MRAIPNRQLVLNFDEAMKSSGLPGLSLPCETGGHCAMWWEAEQQFGPWPYTAATHVRWEILLKNQVHQSHT